MLVYALLVRVVPPFAQARRAPALWDTFAPHCIGGRLSLGRAGQTEQTGRTDKQSGQTEQTSRTDRQDGQTEQTDRTDRQNGERKKTSGPRGPLAAGHAEMFKAS